MAQDERLASLKIDRDPRRSGSRSARMLAGFFAIAAVAAGAWWMPRGSGLPTVRTRVVQEVRVEEATTVLNASGYVTARLQATVSSKVTGRVTEVLIEEGMEVVKGQLLARVDDSNARVNLRLAEAQVGAATTALEETRVRRREAELKLDRMLQLYERNIVSQSERDRAQAQVDSLSARLQQQDEEIKVAEGRVALWQQELLDREIRAPFAGVVVSKDAQPGEMISPMSAGGSFTRTGIGTIVDMSSLEIEVDVNESYINRVYPDQPVEAVLDAYADWKIPAHVIAIVPTADRQRATVKVRIGFEELDPRILPDMGVKVAFRDTETAGESRTALAIPRIAIRDQDGIDVVLVIVDGLLERRVIRIGETRGEQAFILSGVSAGERVVIEGADGLSDGDPVLEVTQ